MLALELEPEAADEVELRLGERANQRVVVMGLWRAMCMALSPMPPLYAAAPAPVRVSAAIEA